MATTVTNRPICSQAPIPTWIRSAARPAFYDALSVGLGSALLAGLAQVTIPLPFTPVPITGQTFGVALLDLGWGRKRALGAFALYLTEGAIGLPVFAHGESGIGFGPTLGYLFGMALACAVVGTFADRGFTKTKRGALIAAYAGSICIFTCGLFGLSFYVPHESLLAKGLFPFLLGDTIKNASAAILSSRFAKTHS